MANQPKLRDGPWPKVAGYQALGDLMGDIPKMAIFRRFRNAGALDLLYRQADLQHSIDRWAQESWADKSAGDDKDKRRRFDLYFYLLQASSTTSEPKDAGKAMQWQAWCEVREKLDQYYDRLLKFQKICNLAPVDDVQVQQLRDHLDHPDQGNAFLIGSESQIYEALYNSDLTSITRPDGPDWLTKIARGPAAHFLFRLRGLDDSGRTIKLPRLARNDEATLQHKSDVLEYRIKDYSDETILKFSMVVYALITSILITVALLTLNRAKGIGSRVSLIWVHNSAFTIAMAVFTNVRPVELFAAAAAYAAVLVVFASDNFGLGDSKSA